MTSSSFPDHSVESIEVSETSRLLTPVKVNSTDETTNHGNINVESEWHERWICIAAFHWRRWKVQYLCAIVVAFMSLGSYIALPAQLRMLEGAICKRYYMIENPSLVGPNGDVPEEFCKMDPVQEELAFIGGGSGALDSLVGVLFAVPWGILADTYSRKLVAALAFIGCILAQCSYFGVCYLSDLVSPRAIWASSALLAIGGGAPVAFGVIMGIVADASAPDVRAATLSRLQAVNLAAVVVGQPVGAALLGAVSYWVPAWIGVAVETVTLFCLIWLPAQSEAIQQRAVSGDTDDTDSLQTQADATWSLKFRTAVSEGLSNMRSFGYVVYANKTLAIGLLVLTLTKIGGPLLLFVPQFASKRFHWTISRSSYISSVQGVASIIMLMLVIPAATKAFQSNLKISGPSLDLKLARWSISPLALGCFLLGLANVPGLFIIALVVYVLGVGFRPALESFLASTIPHSQMAMLYVLIAVMDTAGIMVASPLIAIVFGQGLHRGGAWIGLPFITASILYVVSGMLTMILRAVNRE